MSSLSIDPTVLLVALLLGASFSYALLSKSAIREDAYFKKYKKLSIKDELIIDMLEETSNASWVLTDPDMTDNPIIHSSKAFCALTKYSRKEIEGRNCRFLQGKETDPADVDAIRDAVHDKKEVSVCLMNYTKHGEQFLNQVLSRAPWIPHFTFNQRCL